ncbi:MAG: divergent polysaccharide deacetylase family protein [Rhodospirillaceae bacterium]|nr:divergent polysaccharide deacetylase family protein [Rhodospirillaceae bacterium]
MATPSTKPRKRKTGILGVHPLLAAAAAMVLVLFGVISGAWLNVKLCDPDVQVAAATKPAAAPRPALRPRNFPPPVMPELPSEDMEAPPQFGPPLRQANVAAVPADVPQVMRSVTAKLQADPLAENRVAYTGKPTTPAIAIVIDDMGLNRVGSQRMIELPGPLTLSFITYAENLASWVARARASGHEILAHVPMEPLDAREFPGPGALTTAMTEAEIAPRLEALLDPWNGYVGVNNHMGSRFTADQARMGAVIDVLKRRNLLWFDSKTGFDSVGTSLAKAAGVPALDRDFFLDNVQTAEEVQAQLARVEQLARTRGTAVAIGHPHDVTIAALQAWLPTLNDHGVVLAPLTEIARRQGQLDVAQARGAEIH